jgi:hypothetical protein
MDDYVKQLALTEAVFRAEVVTGLKREAQRLHDHRSILGDRPATSACLNELATVLLDVAEVLRVQDGRLSRASRPDSQRLVRG